MGILGKKKEPQKALPSSGTNVFATSVTNSFSFLRRALRFTGRFPIYQVQREDFSYEYYYKKCSPTYIVFIVTSVLIFIQFVLYSLNLWGVLLNFPPAKNVSIRYYDQERNVTIKRIDAQNIRAYELYIVQRNLVPIMVILFSFLVSVIANYSFHSKLKYACEYYSFITSAVEQMRIDAARGLSTKVFWFIVLYFSYLVLLLIFALTAFAPTTSGTASAFFLLHVRIFQMTTTTHWVPYMHEGFHIYSKFVAILIFYIFWNSKCFIILYYWNCRILSKAFRVFNHRLERVLHRGEYLKSRTEKVATRTGYDHLFRDHGCLLDLIDGADLLYASMVNPFYATQIITLCFEFFHGWRSQQAYDEFRGARHLDGVILFFQFTHSVIICILVSLAAASISDEAIDGLQIIRRKGMLGHKEDEELYFMLSMYVSYTGHLDTALSAGGYGTINKQFLLGIMGTMMCYFIILFQFTPSLVFKHNYLLRDLKDENQAMGLTEKQLIILTEGNENPYGQGRTFLTFDGLSVDAEGKVTDIWDFVHSLDFSAYLNNSSSKDSNDL